MEVHVSCTEAAGHRPHAGGATDCPRISLGSIRGARSEAVGEESSRKLSELESRANPTDHVLDQSIGLKK